MRAADAIYSKDLIHNRPAAGWDYCSFLKRDCNYGNALSISIISAFVIYYIAGVDHGMNKRCTMKMLGYCSTAHELYDICNFKHDIRDFKKPSPDAGALPPTSWGYLPTDIV